MRTRRFGIAVSMCLLAAGCATQEGAVREGRQYGVTEGVFHGRWWNYYERGASYLAGQFYEEAAADFAQAVTEDSRQALGEQDDFSRLSLIGRRPTIASRSEQVSPRSRVGHDHWTALVQTLDEPVL